MGGRDADEVERRLNDGERLRIGDLMVLFNTSRSNVDRWLRNGVVFAGKRLLIHYWLLPDGTRECDPDDVKAVLAEARKRRSADDPEGNAGQ